MDRKSSTMISESFYSVNRRGQSVGQSFSSRTSKVSTAKLSASPETLIHWYRSHHTGLRLRNPNAINTEESDNEYVIDVSRYQYKCLSILCNPYAKCYMRVKKIRAYRHYIQRTFEQVFKTLRWIDLPGGQHRVAVERNYLMNYIWLMCFIVSEVDTTNKDSARHIRYRLEELLLQAENLGVSLQSFFEPLKVLAQNHALVEQMGDLLQYKKITRPRAEKKILRLDIKPDNTMLCGNKVEDFSKLLIYVRKDCQVWTRFKSLTDSDKVDVVTKGLQELADTLKELKGLLKRPIRAMKAGGGVRLSPLAIFSPTLVPHVQQMRNEVKAILRKSNNSLDGEDRAILEALLSEVASHYNYVLKFGELLVEEIWDIILMVRLSYNYIKDSPLNSVCAVSYDAVLTSKVRVGRMKKFLKASHYTVEDFFLVDCPDTLRKLPVVVAPANAELSLHLQGHRNFHQSTTSSPSHKFSFKTRKSSSTKPTNHHLESVNAAMNAEPKKLMFVSEGD